MRTQLFGSIAGKFFTKLSGRTAYILLEQTNEMLRILKTERIGNFAYIQLIVNQIAFRQFYYFLLYVLLRRLAGLLLDDIAEIARRQANLVGKEFHRGQTVADILFTGKIFVQQLFETGQHTVVHRFARTELAVVEAQTIGYSSPTPKGGVPPTAHS